MEMFLILYKIHLIRPIPFNLNQWSMTVGYWRLSVSFTHNQLIGLMLSMADYWSVVWELKSHRGLLITTIPVVYLFELDEFSNSKQEMN